MKLPRSFLGAWALIGLGTLLLSAVLIAAVALISGEGWELVDQRLESGGALGALVGFLILTLMVAAGVHAKNRGSK